MNLKHLETLYWLSRLKHFKKTAEKLNISQSAISLRVASLEKLLGVTLINREAADFELTSFGEEVLRYAEEVLSLNERLAIKLRDPRAFVGRLRIGAVGPAVFTWLPDLMAVLEERYPQLVVEVHTSSVLELSRDLSLGFIDLAVLSGEPTTGPLTLVDLCSYRVGWVARAGCFDIPAPINLSQLDEVPIISYPKTSPLHRPIERLLSKAGPSRPRLHHATALATMMRMLMAGLGISPIPPAVLAREIAAGEVVEVPIRDQLPPLRLQIARVPSTHKTTLDEIVALAVDTARDFCDRQPEGWTSY